MTFAFLLFSFIGPFFSVKTIFKNIRGLCYKSGRNDSFKESVTVEAHDSFYRLVTIQYVDSFVLNVTNVMRWFIHSLCYKLSQVIHSHIMLLLHILIHSSEVLQIRPFDSFILNDTFACGDSIVSVGMTLSMCFTCDPWYKSWPLVHSSLVFKFH